MSHTASLRPSAAHRPLPMLRLPRPVWLLAGLGSAAGAVAASSPLILPAWILPDLALLAGGTAVLRGGAMDRRAIRAYNAAHVLAGPALLLAASALVPALAPLGLIWLSHVAIDRGLGYTPRGADGLPRRV